MNDAEPNLALELDDFRSPDVVPGGDLPNRVSGGSRPALEPFLKGPVPIPWLIAAGALPGKSLTVGIALWFKSGLSSSRTIKPTGTLWRQFGLSRQAVYRALRHLESEGLIVVERRRGRNPIVTIKDVHRDS